MAVLIFQVVQWEWDIRYDVEEDKDRDMVMPRRMMKIIRLMIFFEEEDDDGDVAMRI